VCPSDKPHQIASVCYAECVTGYVDVHPYCEFPATPARGLRYRCDNCQYLVAVQQNQPGCDCDYGYYATVPYSSCQCHTQRYPKPLSLVGNVAPSCYANQTQYNGECYEACPPGHQPVISSDPTQCQPTCPSYEPSLRLCNSVSSVSACARNRSVCDAGLTAPTLTLQLFADVASLVFPFYNNGQTGPPLSIDYVSSLSQFYNLQLFGRLLQRQLRIVQSILNANVGSHLDILTAANHLNDPLQNYFAWQDRTMNALLNSGNALNEPIDFLWPDCFQPMCLVGRMKYYLLALLGALASHPAPCEPFC